MLGTKHRSRRVDFAVLAAKLAVLAAMLAVLDGKLADQGGPNGVRSRPRALFERVRRLDRRRGRSEDDFSSFLSCRVKPPMCILYQFLQCFVALEQS